MKKYIIILMAIGCVGCTTVRKGIDFVDKGIETVVSVKDPVLNGARAVVDASEQIKNAATAGTKTTTEAVVK